MAWGSLLGGVRWLALVDRCGSASLLAFDTRKGEMLWPDFRFWAPTFNPCPSVVPRLYPGWASCRPALASAAVRCFRLTALVLWPVGL